MSDSAQLKQIVGELFQVAPERIDADFPLRHPRLQGSASRGVLAAAIRRRLGVYVAATFSVRTYGELEAAVCGTNGTAAAAAAPPPADAAVKDLAPETGAGMAVGVDIEMVESLPEVGDFWTSDFYRSHFSATEIAYCLRQEHPRMHFAARWCAKEALAKCDRRFMDVDPSTVQVTLAGDGRPTFEWIRGGRTERLPHALSLTHTSLLAAAVVAAAPANMKG